jgi:uncharacterized protein YbbC (DUF1343 family)
MAQVKTGIMRLRDDKSLQDQFKGNIGILCHSASIDEHYNHSLEIMIQCFGERVIKVFGPQHGFVTDVQDNMIETDHFVHPYFKVPIYSLYSETRVPTDEMLENIDHLFVDLQDVGTRIYTYIYTLTHLLEKCADKDIEVIVLDRPNPINATTIEGNILDTDFSSFVGRHPMPVRHALTMGEVALMHQKFWFNNKANLKIIEMQNYRREITFWNTGLPYVNPSPNLPTIEGCFTFVGTVLFEGTNISEGRGTTRALEQIGHPIIDPWKMQSHFNEFFKEHKMEGFKLRPVNFHPMFQKYAGQTCGGFFIHITDLNTFKAWKFAQLFTKEFRRLYPEHFDYKQDAYEYGDGMNPIDMINGTDRLRHWYEAEEFNSEFLDQIESEKMQDFLSQRQEILIYK